MTRSLTHARARLPALALGLALAGALATGASAQMVMLSATLDGASEKPAAGDADGSGMAMIHADAAKSQICYELHVKDIAPATMAHIHKAPADAAGPVAVPLASPDAAGQAKACVDAAAEVVKDIVENPGAYYVNVHNAEFKAGAIRGQLHK